jgi:hypothetical protein
MVTVEGPPWAMKSIGFELITGIFVETGRLGGNSRCFEDYQREVSSVY